MLLKGISLDNKVIKKAIFRLCDKDILLDVTFKDSDDCEILNMGLALHERGEIDKLHDGLTNQGITVSWALSITLDNENMTATFNDWEDDKDYEFNDF